MRKFEDNPELSDFDRSSTAKLIETEPMKDTNISMKDAYMQDSNMGSMMLRPNYGMNNSTALSMRFSESPSPNNYIDPARSNSVGS